MKRIIIFLILCMIPLATAIQQNSSSFETNYYFSSGSNTENTSSFNTSHGIGQESGNVTLLSTVYDLFLGIFYMNQTNVTEEPEPAQVISGGAYGAVVSGACSDVGYMCTYDWECCGNLFCGDDNTCEAKEESLAEDNLTIPSSSMSKAIESKYLTAFMLWLEGVNNKYFAGSYYLMVIAVLGTGLLISLLFTNRNKLFVKKEKKRVFINRR